MIGRGGEQRAWGTRTSVEEAGGQGEGLGGGVSSHMIVLRSVRGHWGRGWGVRTDFAPPIFTLRGLLSQFRQEGVALFLFTLFLTDVPSMQF